jgi:3-hydroxybutyryl-CoA dehydrogenase
MKIVVITNEWLKEELLAQGLQEDVQVEWQEAISPVPDADAYIDLLFNLSVERMDSLKLLWPATIIVNSVTDTADKLPGGFTRINGWRSFLKRTLVEASSGDADRTAVEKIFSCFNKTVEWVPDIPGFITPRVISMIINEAYFTLDEQVSSKEEIDTAMKLGTNYPYGPFAWGETIGLKHVSALLSTLAKTNARYTASSLLQKEALSS